MPKKRRSPEQWQAIIAEYESSGLSREEFCRTRKLHLDYFGKRLRLSKKPKLSRTDLKVDLGDCPYNGGEEIGRYSAGDKTEATILYINGELQHCSTAAGVAGPSHQFRRTQNLSSSSRSQTGRQGCSAAGQRCWATAHPSPTTGLLDRLHLHGRRLLARLLVWRCDLEHPGERRMTFRSLVMATVVICGPSPAAAKLFLLGDFTPIFALTAQAPYHQGAEPHPGNQQLFLRFAKGDKASKVLMRFGEEQTRNAINELRHFYGLNNIVSTEAESLSSDELAYVDLLIVGNPDWTWTDREVGAVTDFAARGGNVLIVVEPLLCAGTCRESTAAILKALGSSLHVGSIPTSGNQWALLAAQPFMDGIRPVTYGFTYSVEGGTELMYESTGLSMLSVDDPQASFRQLEAPRK